MNAASPAPKPLTLPEAKAKVTRKISRITQWPMNRVDRAVGACIEAALRQGATCNQAFEFVMAGLWQAVKVRR